MLETPVFIDSFVTSVKEFFMTYLILLRRAPLQLAQESVSGESERYLSQVK
jgi:hypothetical protein